MADETIPVVKNNPAKTANSQPTVTVKLPSGGLYYPETSPLSLGTLEIYQVTARHEDILSNSALLRKGTVLDEFLKAVIATPGVSLNDMFIGDKNALYLEARKSAYGEIYSTKVKCPACGVESVVDIDLNLLKNKPLPVDAKRGENKFVFTLPNSKKTITWGMLTHKDEGEIDVELKRFSSLGATSSPEITTRLKYTIKSVDGETDRGKIKIFVDTQLSARDALALRRQVREVTPDVDMSFEFTCPVCSAQEKISVPLGASFFWPSVNDA
jgi:transcription elongation factor Elf1